MSNSITDIRKGSKKNVKDYLHVIFSETHCPRRHKPIAIYFVDVNHLLVTFNYTDSSLNGDNFVFMVIY